MQQVAENTAMLWLASVGAPSQSLKKDCPLKAEAPTMPNARGAKFSGAPKAVDGLSSSEGTNHRTILVVLTLVGSFVTMLVASSAPLPP